MKREISSIPFIGGSGTVRDDILRILSSEFPLSTKEVYARVQKRKRVKDFTPLLCSARTREGALRAWIST